MASIAPIGPSDRMMIPPLPSSIQEVTVEDFFTRFATGKEVALQESASIEDPEETMFTSQEDGITIFAIEKTAEGDIARILGCHVPPSTNKADVKIELEGMIHQAAYYAVIIVGENGTLEKPSYLVDVIREAILEMLPLIEIEEHLYFKNWRSAECISAGIGMDGILVLCKHPPLPLPVL